MRAVRDVDVRRRQRVGKDKEWPKIVVEEASLESARLGKTSKVNPPLIMSKKEKWPFRGKRCTSGTSPYRAT